MAAGMVSTIASGLAMQEENSTAFGLAMRKENPTMQEFLDKGVLVHVGSLCIEKEKREVSIKGYKPLTYWSLNQFVPNDQFFFKHGNIGCIVLTPLKKHLHKLFSICAQEVMLLDDCVQLGEGDIVLFQKDAWLDVYNKPIEESLKFEQERIAQSMKETQTEIDEVTIFLEKNQTEYEQLLAISDEAYLKKKFGDTPESLKEEESTYIFWKKLDIASLEARIKLAEVTLAFHNNCLDNAHEEREGLESKFIIQSSCFTGQGRRIYYSAEERELMIELGIDVRSEFQILQNLEDLVREVLLSKNYWSIQFEGSFWTHKTPFLVDQVRVSRQNLFFETLLQNYPLVSFGYEFYSQRGYASLIRVLFDDFDEYGHFRTLYPEWFDTLHNFVKNSLVEHFNTLSMDEARKKQLIQRVQDVKISKDENDNNESSLTHLDYFLMKVVLPFSPEVFQALDRQIMMQPHLKDTWSIIREGYTLAEHHRQQTRIADGGEDFLQKVLQLSVPAQRELYIAATGFDFITGDGYELPGSPQDSFSLDPEDESLTEEERLKMLEEKAQKIYEERKGYFNSHMQQWFSSL